MEIENGETTASLCCCEVVVWCVYDVVMIRSHPADRLPIGVTAPGGPFLYAFISGLISLYQFRTKNTSVQLPVVSSLLAL